MKFCKTKDMKSLNNENWKANSSKYLKNINLIKKKSLKEYEDD